ncbi:DUF2306 domain-containing protein [uncultured Devosia sp.]|uniref:DUF2306 domain-containing protein n=1 Tax=uncultured Devosia sp. TaxID=211434 RepID=UPI002630474E|nr:DUF2306 domain-containing protein [uncultured Devosia sp.]
MTANANRLSNWVPLALLIVLGLLPLLPAVGRMVVRFADVGAPPEMLADTSRFFVMPVPVVLHIVSACLFALVGALQFSTTLRRSPWHRFSGRVLVIAGVLAATSGLWLTNFYPLLGNEGPLLYWFRTAAGLAMLWFLVQGYRAARRRRFDEHRPHMIRAYALGLGASTQMLIGITVLLMFGEPTPIVGDLMLGAGWAINLVVAQWAIVRSRTPIRRAVAVGA